MTIKQIKQLFLVLLTLVSLSVATLSLISSLNQPQVQSRLELYQTNLLLHATEYQFDQNLDNTEPDLVDLRQTLLGEKPLQTAQKQYQKARQETDTNTNDLQFQLQQLADLNLDALAKANVQQQQALQQEIAEGQKYLNELDLRIGILQVQQGEIETAQKTWQQLIESTYKEESFQPLRQTAATLIGLWSQPPLISPLAQEQITINLDSWFRYRALQQLYTLQKRQDDLVTLRTQEQQSAQQALIKLASIAAIPTLGGILGVGLLIFLAIQWFIKRQDSLLGAGVGTPWSTPWDGEIIWQVMIVGFFFISQILLPLIVVPILVKVVGLNLVAMGLRGKAVTVLVSYLLMAVGGLVVLYLSLKAFFPLSEEWFRFQVKGKWILWGVGGYLVALPLVVLVSLLNQQIWQGQGGSNPIILLALQAQDRVALTIFFFTASIAAPVFEEIIFRGFFLPSLTRYLPVGVSILVSSLVFALAHLSLSEVLPLTTLGMILGFVYVRSRNLLAPILLHSLWNGGTLLSLFILGSGVG